MSRRRFPRPRERRVGRAGPEATEPGLSAPPTKRPPLAIVLILVASALAFAGCASGQAVSGPGASPAPGAKDYSLRMAESVVARAPMVHPSWDYTAGVVLDAIERVGERTGDARLLDYVRRNVDRQVQPDGRILDYDSAALSLDEIAEGRVVLMLLARTGDARYRAAAAVLRDQLRRQPRTAEGGFWHKLIYPQQMWLDGIYMAGPFYVRWAQTANEAAAYDDAARQVLLAASHLRDAQTGLYWHGWDAAHTQIWANPQTGTSPNFWGRGLGWYAMALVDMLEVLPPGHPDRAQILRLLEDLAPAIARVQDPATGLWYQVLDQPSRAGNYLETSASAMFVYALARGANRGWLPPAYRDVAQRGFDGLVREKLKTNADGTLSLTGICQVAGLGGKQQRDGSFDYYIHEPVVADDYKGVGPFIMAALELGR